MNKPCISAFPIEGEGRLLRSGSISRLILPFTFVPACTLSVYASQWVLPPAHARLDTWLLARLCHGGHLRPLNLLRFKAQPSQTPPCAIDAAGSSSATPRFGPGMYDLRWHERMAAKQQCIFSPSDGS